MRLAGAALVTAAGFLAGLGVWNGLRERADLRRSLCRMLALMEFELERFRTPAPALFALLADRLEGEAGALCRRMCRGLETLGQRPLEEIWGEALGALPETERRILLPLGQVLGRYGAEEVLSALASCRVTMERAWDEARTALRERGRMAVGVSAAGAAALAVLLL